MQLTLYINTQANNWAYAADGSSQQSYNWTVAIYIHCSCKINNLGVLVLMYNNINSYFINTIGEIQCLIHGHVARNWWEQGIKPPTDGCSNH